MGDGNSGGIEACAMPAPPNMSDVCTNTPHPCPASPDHRRFCPLPPAAPQCMEEVREKIVTVVSTEPVPQHAPLLPSISQIQRPGSGQGSTVGSIGGATSVGGGLLMDAGMMPQTEVTVLPGGVGRGVSGRVCHHAASVVCRACMAALGGACVREGHTYICICSGDPRSPP